MVNGEQQRKKIRVDKKRKVNKKKAHGINASSKKRNEKEIHVIMEPPFNIVIIKKNVDFFP